MIPFFGAHQLKRGDSRRAFNTEYLALCEHLELEPRTIAVASPNQNGDVEAAQGVLKRRLDKNQLILRRSRDFESVASYAEFVAGVCRGANAPRATKLAEERAHLRALPAGRFPETEEITVRVSSYCTARVRACAYSVPARLTAVGYARPGTRGRVSTSAVLGAGEKVAKRLPATLFAPSLRRHSLLLSFCPKSLTIKQVHICQ